MLKEKLEERQVWAIENYNAWIQLYRSTELQRRLILYTQYCISFHLIHTSEEIIKVKR